jgi:hypothetical protein
MASYTDLSKKIRLVHDLVWLQAADSDRLSIVEAAGAAREVVQVVNSYGSIMVGQYLPKLDGGGKGKTLVSFAAFMAAYLKDERQALVCLETGPGTAAMVGLVNGLPVPDADRYGSREDIVKLAAEFLSDYPEATCYGNVQGFDTQAMKPLDLDGLMSDKFAAQLIRLARIRPLSAGGSPLVWVLILVAFVIVGYMGYDYYETKIKPPPPPLAQAQQEKPPEQIYAEGLNAAIRQQGMSVAAALQLIQAARSETLVQPGWRMTRLKCSAGACSALWVRQTNSASFEDLVQALGGEKIQLQPDQTALQAVSFPMANTESGYPDPLALPKKQDAWVSLLSPLQRTAGRVPFAVTAGAAFPVQGLTPPNSIFKNEFTVSGPVWADTYLSALPTWVMIKEFAFEIAEGAQQSEGTKIDANLIFFTKD